MNERESNAILRRRLQRHAPFRCIDTGNARIDRSFLRDTYGWLLWSNPSASDEVLRLKIMLEGGIFDLINLAKVYGWRTLHSDFEKIQEFDELRSNSRRRERIQGIIRNIERRSHAAKRNRGALATD